VVGYIRAEKGVVCAGAVENVRGLVRRGEDDRIRGRGIPGYDQVVGGVIVLQCAADNAAKSVVADFAHKVYLIAQRLKDQTGICHTAARADGGRLGVNHLAQGRDRTLWRIGCGRGEDGGNVYADLAC
jgi:hypothetical protein